MKTVITTIINSSKNLNFKFFKIRLATILILPDCISRVLFYSFHCLLYLYWLMLFGITLLSNNPVMKII